MQAEHHVPKNHISPALPHLSISHLLAGLIVSERELTLRLKASGKGQAAGCARRNELSMCWEEDSGPLAEALSWKILRNVLGVSGTVCQGI